ncbi:hypothetical protein ACFUTV_26690 [Streptomyces sp. NPDC057298]
MLEADRLAAGATRVGLKALVEDLRGLVNSFTALYARMLIEDHPQ